MIDGAKRGRDLLALQALEIALRHPGILAGNDRHSGIGAELGGVAAVVAESHEIHASQHGTDHRYSHLHNFAFAGLERVKRVDARGVGSRDRDVEALLLEEATL